MYCEHFCIINEGAFPPNQTLDFRHQTLDGKDLKSDETMQGFPLRGSSAVGGDEVESQTSDFRRQTLDGKALNFAEAFRLPCVKGAVTTEGCD